MIKKAEIAHRIYVDEEVKQKFVDVALKDYFNPQKAFCEVVAQGVVLPTIKQVNEEDVGYFKGGVVDANGKFVEASANRRKDLGGSMFEAYPFEADEVDVVPEEVVYGGILVNHFGHFLMESTNRLWFWVENSDKDLGVVFLMPKKQKVIRQFWEFMDLLGIKRDKVYLIHKPTRFAKVYVPSPSHVLGLSYGEKFLVPFQAIRDKVKGRGENKIYLSRTKFKGGTVCLGEKYIEKLFYKNGYKILYPEQLSLKEQIEYLKDAKEIVGVIGTATHLIVFAQKGVKSVILSRCDYPIEEQDILHQAVDADWYEVGANLNPFPVDHSTGPTLLGISSSLYQYCQDQGLKADASLVGYVKKSDGKAFVKDYMKRYTQQTYNHRLAKIDPLIARRLLVVSKAFIPLKRLVKQTIKALHNKKKKI